MEQKNTNSKSYEAKKKQKTMGEIESNDGTQDQIVETITGGGPKPNLQNFDEDERGENADIQQEDIAAYLEKVKGRIDTIVGAMKESEEYYSESTNERVLREQA